MASDDKSGNDRDAKFALGTRETRHSANQRGLELAAPHRAAPTSQGSDPYNTSGSFDRKKNWERVGKR
jgi:hypothetical protein